MEKAMETRSADGASIAALFAPAVGLLTLAIVQVASELSSGFKDWVFALGKAWIPGAEGIGPYSGKETLLLIGWIVSWLGLHFALRGRELRVKPWFGAALAILFVATLLLWPPVWHLVKGT